MLNSKSFERKQVFRITCKEITVWLVYMHKPIFVGASDITSGERRGVRYDHGTPSPLWLAGHLHAPVHSHHQRIHSVGSSLYTTNSLKALAI